MLIFLLCLYLISYACIYVIITVCSCYTLCLSLVNQILNLESWVRLKTEENHFFVSKGFMGRNDCKWCCCVIWYSPYNHMELSTTFQFSAKDRPRFGKPKRLTPREESYIRILASGYCFLPVTRIVDRVRRAAWVRISAQTVRNDFKACRFKSRRPHKCMQLTVHHKTHRNAWVNQHMHRSWRMNLDSHLSLQMVAFVSADGLVNAFRRFVLS